MPLLRPLQDASGIDEVLAEFADLAVPLLRAETRALAGAIRRGDVTGWAAFDGEGAGAVGALIYRRRETRAEVTFIHVLGAMQGRGLEEALVAGAVSGFRAAGLREVYCDCVIAGDPQPVRHGFSLLGFEEFPKSLMVVDLGPGTAVSCRGLPGLAIAAWDERYVEQAAAVVHRATRRARTHTGKAPTCVRRWQRSLRQQGYLRSTAQQAPWRSMRTRRADSGESRSSRTRARTLGFSPSWQLTRASGAVGWGPPWFPGPWRYATNRPGLHCTSW